MIEEIELAAILTGGRASRMNGDKAERIIGGKPLVRHVYDAVAPLSRRVACVGLSAGLESEGVVTVPDLFPGTNSLGGIATALEYAGRNFGEEALVLCVGCDMPFIGKPLVRGLLEAVEGHEIAVPRNEKGYEPLLAIYRAKGYPVIKKQLEEGHLRIRDIFFKLSTRILEGEELEKLDPQGRSFFNVNTPGDIEKMAALQG